MSLHLMHLLAGATVGITVGGVIAYLIGRYL